MPFIKRWVTPAAVFIGVSMLVVAYMLNGMWTIGFPGLVLMLGGLIYGLR